jgi:Glyoxalase-like domain
MTSRIDHLIVVADTLDQGTQWCEATLGALPVAGGRHALMSTHNRLLAISSERFPQCYLEVIAIDPDAPPPARARWFGMDGAALREAVREAPRFVHAAARTQMIEMLRWGLINCGIHPGDPIAAHRDTPAGRLSWRIMLRDDGTLACGGAVPTLIEWQGPHPSERLPPSSVALRELELRGLPPRAADVLKLAAVRSEPSSNEAAPQPTWCATFDTPRGSVTLPSWPHDPAAP